MRLDTLAFLTGLGVACSQIANAQPARPPVAYLMTVADFPKPGALPWVGADATAGAFEAHKFGLRIGTGLGKLYYPDDQYAGKAWGDNPLSWTGGVSLHFQSSRHWGGMTGLFFTSRRSRSSNTQPVPAGFSNAGSPLTLRQNLAISAIQLPLLAQFLPKTRAGGIQPFIALGPVINCDIVTTTTQDAVVSAYQPGQFLPMQTTQALDFGDSRNVYPAIGLQVNAGLRLPAGDVPLVAELFYENGRELVANNSKGNLRYQSAGLRVGIDF